MQQLAPQVDAAQKASDSYAYFLALRDLAMTFKDGHVNLDGANNQQRFNQRISWAGMGLPSAN